GNVVNLENREIGTFVGADDGGGLLLAILEHHRHLAGIGNHVVVGDEVAVSGNREAGAGGHELAHRTVIAATITLPAGATRIAELPAEAIEEVTEGVILRQIGELEVEFTAAAA